MYLTSSLIGISGTLPHLESVKITFSHLLLEPVKLRITEFGFGRLGHSVEIVINNRHYDIVKYSIVEEKSTWKRTESGSEWTKTTWSEGLKNVCTSPYLTLETIYTNPNEVYLSPRFSGDESN